ncbi:MAG: hypothetical protein N2Z73_01795, partial [Endomicrobia bacterium]|nr:hypothetical protein [Endomicrobiia bacterium]
MSKMIATKAILGAHKIVSRAEEMLNKALEKYGKNLQVGFPDTAYYLPFIYAMTAEKVQKLGDLIPILDHAKKL